MTTKGAQAYTDFMFQLGDTIMVRRESAGGSDEVQPTSDARLLIPIAPAIWSINVAISAAIVTGEVLRQTAIFPTKA